MNILVLEGGKGVYLREFVLPGQEDSFIKKKKKPVGWLESLSM